MYKYAKMKLNSMFNLFALKHKNKNEPKILKA